MLTCFVVLQIKGCIAIKGAEDSQVCAGKQHAFEISTQATGPQYFIAPDGRVRSEFLSLCLCLIRGIKTLESESVIATLQEKEDWINAIGQAIVRQSRSALAEEQTDYI